MKRWGNFISRLWLTRKSLERNEFIQFASPHPRTTQDIKKPNTPLHPRTSKWLICILHTVDASRCLDLWICMAGFLPSSCYERFLDWKVTHLQQESTSNRSSFGSKPKQKTCRKVHPEYDFGTAPMSDFGSYTRWPGCPESFFKILFLGKPFIMGT